ncbi:isoaspartyl peptidase/L-asparaginase family protein [Hirschia baltica]|uniref:Isoaspartyl peptidase n=1 Tax=Hirschia baltica (strain ATCC 49814 / DSM 5838 / IFAM 1418) TaxID=582402 RepID=C6XIS7_HIRBI|nr:isoaspartyl peptidase/L-asparaginase [Hirschia baltica]ACT59022.1 peptidase T2 asparaginase 2 [Hirschia baltica ATCC 49814]
MLNLSRRVLLVSCGVVFSCFALPSSAQTGDKVQTSGLHTTMESVEAQEWTLVIHGGAGVIERRHMTAERELAYHKGLEEALLAGQTVLANGGEALDAVEAAVILLEDNPAFNAGHGAVLTAAGDHELDASIMDGRNTNAGAVAGVKTVKNPVLAARAVMEKSEHVMFAGEAASEFAHSHGVERVENTYFTTEARKAALERVLKTRAEKADKRGTVGAVAIDVRGNIAAATSTGGMTAKAPGRVGDAPIVGAGVYADNNGCGVSATGHGEYFIRTAVAKTVCSRIELLDEAPEDAGKVALDKVADLGGDGGVIVISKTGASAFVFNTPGMFRGIVTADGTIETRIYGDAP